jgi:transposase
VFGLRSDILQKEPAVAEWLFDLLAIRPFCLGRRGWLFADTVVGANASANLYSLVETCKANGIDPYCYLTCLFQCLPLAKTVDDYDALLPWKMPVDLR